MSDHAYGSKIPLGQWGPVNMSDCNYGSNIPLVQWGHVNMSDCAYGSNSHLGQVKSIINAFLILLRVILANNSRLVLVGAAVSFIRVLATATVVFTAVVREIVNTGTELPHRTLHSSHLRGALPDISTQRVLVGPQISPDLEHSIALSGVHQIVLYVVINKDTVDSDMTVYNVRLHAINGVLVRAGPRVESG